MGSNEDLFFNDNNLMEILENKNLNLTYHHAII